MHRLEGKRVFVAGHRGMVGAAMVRRLAREGCEILTAPRTALDLRDQRAVEAWMGAERPDVVVLAAAKVGGIVANASAPVAFLQDNLQITVNVLAAAHAAGVERLLFLGSSCVYPRLAPQPIAEESLLTGPLEPTNQWYAIAKIAGLKLVEAYRREEGRDWISAMPTNLYGPGDNYDLATSHVLPALLRKFHEARLAGRREVVVWGTGRPLREFMHCDDLADALVHLLRHYSGDVPVNVGSGEEISIADLARLVGETVGGRIAIRFDPSRPDGTPRKRLDLSRLHALGWDRARPLREGLAQTYHAALAEGVLPALPGAA
ncbi:MAG: GDP-L-fucose synthase [Alphaproteobacteria bacterium]|nr:MAG: GDP-L-fucose synthase [Alphaproteobacteria bacterium]